LDVSEVVVSQKTCDVMLTQVVVLSRKIFVVFSVTFSTFAVADEERHPKYAKKSYHYVTARFLSQKDDSVKRQSEA